jgi:transposase-like protein
MPNPGLPKDETERRVSALNAALEKGYPPPERATNGQKSAIQAASDALGVNEQTLRTWLRQHRDKIDWSLYQDTSVLSDIPEPEQIEISVLEDKIRTLEAALKSAAKEEITRHAIREKVFEVSESTPEPPTWLTRQRAKKGTIGVPTLFLSDLHWGERVNPTEIYGANEFNLEIAHDRARRAVEMTIDLLQNHLTGPDYPGIVLALGGDMVTGNIHEELTATNDAEIMPTFVDLFGVLVWVIETLTEKFGRVFVPCVTGNHGRNTKKIQYKERNATSFDWLLYRLLQKHFKDDKRVQFLIPDGPDCHYQIYDHRYLLTHGDQFRGGDGLIGPLGPLTRGRHKKASRDASLQRSWDTMICGHFHTLMMLPHLIVNGSLKGLDEYAFANNFGFERPSQALWITQPEQGITFQMPVYVDEPKETQAREWVTWAA